jgi:hypothetical protein
VADEGAVHACPGCGRPVAPGEDYVVAREHRYEAEVALHSNGESEHVERRFHVGHFRGRLGEYFYELIARFDDHPSQ